MDDELSDCALYSNERGEPTTALNRPVTVGHNDFLNPTLIES